MWFAVEGDLRFCSHHEMMSAIERTAGRAQLPLCYSQGFNPHPILSLVLPRPVGLAARDELLVMSLDAAVEPGLLVGRMNEQAHAGMRFLRAEALGHKTAPRTRRIHYELPLNGGELVGVRRRLGQLRQMDSWALERRTPAKRGRPERTRLIDIKPVVTDVKLDGRRLCWTAVPQENLWPRPGELLEMLDINDRAVLARVVRTSVEYEL